MSVATETVISAAVQELAQALSQEPDFVAFEESAQRLRQDAAARQAMEAYQKKQAGLQTLLMLDAVSPDEQAEIESLREAFLSQETVVAYRQAETALRDLCRAVGDQLSARIGLGFAAACSSGCC